SVRRPLKKSSPGQSRDLTGAFLHLASGLNTREASREIQLQIVESVFDMMRVRRVAVLLEGDLPGVSPSEIYQDLETGATEPFAINREIRRIVLDSRIAHISNDGDSV